MKRIIVLLIISLCCYCVFGQDITPRRIKYFNDSTYNGKIKIHQDASLKNFMEISSGLNRKREGFPGYRVKVFAQNKQDSRAKATAIKSKCDNDKHEAYMKFVEPNFEVHVGNFVNRFEALVLLNELIEDYPEAYIVKTIISYPKH